MCSFVVIVGFWVSLLMVELIGVNKGKYKGKPRGSGSSLADEMRF